MSHPNVQVKGKYNLILLTTGYYLTTAFRSLILRIVSVFLGLKAFLKKNTFFTIFFTTHLLFASILGRLYALAPDERGYLSTFNSVYTLPIGTSAQSGSGWITAPTVFLWIAYLPAKLINIFGVPDYLSIRLLSILITTISVYLLIDIQKHSRSVGRFSRLFVIATFFIPSVFLWTSVGLREAFIIAEFAVFLAGFNSLIKGSSKRGMLFLFLGSYGLVSTKNYLWACLMLAVILSCIIFIIQKIDWLTILKLLGAGFLIPLMAFGGTTSAYALDFIFNSDITQTGERSGDSITQVALESPGSGSGSG